MTNYIEEVFGNDGILSKQFPGYKMREQQVELAKAVQKSIKEKKPLLGEAPTGVGKSLATLVPAFEIIKEQDAPVVVVTSSIILQEQYIQKDIPFLEQALGVSTGAVLIKGKGNYLCPKKHLEAKVASMSKFNREEHQKIQDWADHTKTGDVSELPFAPKPQVWGDYAIMDSQECKGKKCPLFNQCFYYKQRRKMESAKLIVCNYHYYFHSLDKEGLLPEGVRVVVMDEGHEVAAIARDFQEKRYGPNSLKRMVSDFAKVIQKLSASGENMEGITDDIGLGNVQMTLQYMISELTSYFTAKKDAYKNTLTINNWHKERIQYLGEAHETALGQAIRNIQKYRRDQEDDYLNGITEEDLTEDEKMWEDALADLQDFLMERRFFVQEFFGLKEIEPAEDTLYWIAEYGQDAVSIHSKPFTGYGLTGQLFDLDEDDPPLIEKAVPIVVSATLASNREFAHIKRDLGIEKEVNECIVDSPFDLENNFLWYLPQDMPPGNEKEHSRAALEEMLEIAQKLNGRTLCLFTSRKSLDEAQSFFEEKLPKHIKVLSQNEMPKQAVIQEMKLNPHNVIVATKSFFTGVDIQGQNLSAVLIDKLPFPMIGDPINDFLMSQDGGFWTFSLPETIISLKQGFGRLNRTHTDRGVVGVFDGRLATARYKGRIFNSFDFNVRATRDKDVLNEYLNEIRKGEGDGFNS